MNVQKNWATPDELSLPSELKTVNGKRVIDVRYEPRNSTGAKVTYPIKGSIVVQEKPFKTEYAIWSADGRIDVVFNRAPELNLVIPSSST